MRPKKHKTTGSNDLFRARLDQIINLKHELVLLAGKIDWDWIDGEIAPLYSENGRPGIETRFMIGLLLLKHIYGLSDEGVCERWVHDPYFQFFTGEEFFQHAFPHERSDLSHWRKRLGDRLELLLAESLRVAHGAGALRSQDLKRVTVDTTVQPKAITFPTDAKLLHAAIKGLNRLARRHSVRLRQSYSRVAKAAAMMAGRYAHAKQFGRDQRQLRMLRSRLGRIIRDIRRKIEGQPALEEAFPLPLGRASQIRSQQQRQRGWKLYSFHAPEVECIGKGKASAPYEFGVKASVVTTNARAPGGQFVLHARTLPGNPYDPHAGRRHRSRSEAYRPRDRACLCRQGIPRPRCPKPAPRLHLRSKTRGLRPHQTRAQTALRHRGGDRTYESRRSSRPLLSQRSRRRCRQRHPPRRRVPPSPRCRLAENDLARRPPCATPGLRNSALQTGFLTGDYLYGVLGHRSTQMRTHRFG